MKVFVYLNFPGNCEEAMTFYHKVLGGELGTMMRFKGSPAEEHVSDPAWLDKVMHTELTLGEYKIMASDTPPQMFKKPEGYHINLGPKDTEEGKRLFDALAEGGTVTMPFEPSFWAKGFGMLTDRFGINWMVNCE